MHVSPRLTILLIVLLLFASACGRRKAAIVKPARIGSTETGIASWYGHPYHGRRAANGEIYDMEKMTAAHRTLPFGTWLRVKNLSNDREVEVRIQDRGPFVDKRIIDLSRAAAEAIEMIRPGIVKVKLTVIAPPEEPSKPAPVPVVSGIFAVQVGAFSDRDRAEALAQRMEAYGRARIIVREAEQTLHRVLVGEHAYIEDAQAALSRIESEGGSGFVVRLDP